jgi:D-alanyl-D-alanine dipeptidase/carboxypeptidase
MRDVILKLEDVYEGDLILVNPQFPYRQKVDIELVSVDEKNPQVLMEAKSAAVLRQVLAKVGAEQQIIAVSGWRSQQEQIQIFEDSLAQNGREFTEKFVALPNCSEHQTGLAIDLALNQPDIDFLCPEFPYNGICQAFREEALLWGFIERYPEGKKAVTSIGHEPWHFRYIGAPHAQIMAQRGLVLEEYHELLKSHPQGQRPLLFEHKGGRARISYVPAAGEKTVLTLPQESCYELSGNNMDGFIITLWEG